jgi:3-phenylpropionate/cinnamic acid dioxygenase small subunit
VNDRDEIVDVLYRYAQAVDSCDWELLRSLFTETVDLDFSAINGQPASQTHRDDWVTYLSALRTELIATQHFISNPRVAITGDRATCTAYVRGEHVVHAGEHQNMYTIGASYADEFVREPAGWRMRRVTVALIWESGDKAAMAVARAKATARSG